MEDFFVRLWTNLVGRLHGPMQFRLVLQPMMASLLAIRAGRKDAREVRPPYLWALAFHAGTRRHLARSAWGDIASVFVIAMLVDAVYQLLTVQWFYPGETVIVALTLAVVPYVALRGIVNRLARRFVRRPADVDREVRPRP